MGISPRLDYAINGNNTLVARYQYNRMSFDNQGIGRFQPALEGLQPGATRENTLQVTETAIVSPRFINETRFQFMRSDSAEHGRQHDSGDQRGGRVQRRRRAGRQFGHAGRTGWSFPITRPTRARRTPSSGADGCGRAYLDSTSVSNFGGTYSFLGGSGPVLDANNQPIAGTSTQLTALEVYQRTLIFQKAGMTRRADPAAGRRRFAIQPERGHAADVGEAVRRRPVRERRLAGASEPDLQLRAALRDAEQHRRPWGFLAARRAGVGNRRQGESGGEDGAARRVRDFLRPRE